MYAGAGRKRMMGRYEVDMCVLVVNHMHKEQYVLAR